MFLRNLDRIPLIFILCSMITRKRLWSSPGWRGKVWDMAVKSCLEGTFYLPSVLFFQQPEWQTCDTLETIHLHFKTGSSSSQNLLSDWNSAKVKSTWSHCTVLSPLLKNSYLADFITKWFLQGLSCGGCSCEIIFFKHPFSLYLLWLWPQSSKGKKGCPEIY